MTKSVIRMLLLQFKVIVFETISPLLRYKWSLLVQYVTVYSQIFINGYKLCLKYIQQIYILKAFLILLVKSFIIIYIYCFVIKYSFYFISNCLPILFVHAHTHVGTSISSLFSPIVLNFNKC